MQDHIGEIKHSAKQIYRCNHITRFEKYKLVREELSHLSLKEKEILIAECKRDLETNKGLLRVGELVNTAIAVLGARGTCIFSGVLTSKGVSLDNVKDDFFLFGMILWVLLLIAYIANTLHNKCDCSTRYLLDILTENE